MKNCFKGCCLKKKKSEDLKSMFLGKGNFGGTVAEETKGGNAGKARRAATFRNGSQIKEQSSPGPEKNRNERFLKRPTIKTT